MSNSSLNFLNVENDSDIKVLSLLASEIWHSYWHALIGEEQTSYMVEKFQSYDAIYAQIQDEGYIYKILNLDGENVGYFGVCAKNKKVWETKNPSLERYLFLSKLYIKESYRGKKLGRQAFSLIKQIARELNLDSIYLTVNKNNFNTIKAYENWGFHTVETAETTIGQGFIMDDYIMKYEL